MTASSASIRISIAVGVFILSCGCWSSRARAEERYNRNSGLATQTNQNEHGEQRGTDRLEPLREGTRVPPTVGRVVMMGRRWAFIRVTQGERERSGAAITPPVNADSRDNFTRVNVLRTKTATSALRYATLQPNSPARPVNVMRPVAMTLVAAPVDPAGNSTAATSAVDLGPQIPARHILISENLMLQRIAEAIRADGSDNLWIVTGEVTEFFSENRLLIHTAQRADAN